MIIDGKAIAEEIQRKIRKEILSLSNPPGLAVIILGENPSSQSYVAMKTKASQAVGIHSTLYRLPASTPELELLTLIQELNHNPRVDGILVQLPLPAHISPMKVVEAIHPDKDVDGFHPTNLGKLLLGQRSGFIPCTPLGIYELLNHSQISVEGKEVVIVGRSAIVGKPLAALLMQNSPGCNATVTVVHSKTHHLKAHTLRAEILVAAIGSPRYIQADMVKEGAVVIDVGINRIDDASLARGYRIVGDVDFESVAPKTSAITPVPKGVGPMTVAMLLKNTLLSHQRRNASPTPLTDCSC